MGFERREQELERGFALGDVIVRDGDESREMFVIQTGRVRITKCIDGADVELAILEKGDFFGEMSLLESLPRTATATALEPTRVLVIQTGTLLLRIRRDPTFAFEMLQKLSGRIRKMNERLMQAMASGKLTEEVVREAQEISEK